MQAKNKYSFSKGWSQLKYRDMKTVQRDICEAIGINNRTSWHNRLYGKIIPKMDEYEKITKIFIKYDIQEIWGN